MIQIVNFDKISGNYGIVITQSNNDNELLNKSKHVSALDKENNADALQSFYFPAACRWSRRDYYSLFLFTQQHSTDRHIASPNISGGCFPKAKSFPLLSLVFLHRVMKGFLSKLLFEIVAPSAYEGQSYVLPSSFNLHTVFIN